MRTRQSQLSTDEPLRTRQGNGQSNLFVAPSGSGVGSIVGMTQRADTANTARVYMLIDASNAQVIADAVGSGTVTPLLFQVGGAERMRITTAGQVGVGTATPGAMLDVNGSLLARGSLNVGNTNQRFRTTTLPSMNIETLDGTLQIGARTTVSEAANAWYDGTNWQRMDTAVGSHLMNHTPTGVAHYFVAAGTGPIASWGNPQMQIGATGAITFTGGGNIGPGSGGLVAMSSTGITGTLTVSSYARIAAGLATDNGILYFRSDNGVTLSWDGWLHSNVQFLTEGMIQTRSRLVTNNWDPGWANCLGGAVISSGLLQTQSRLVTNNWDVGWANSLGGDTYTGGRMVVNNWDGGQVFNVNGNSFTTGYHYQRGNMGYRCWDNGDFNYSPTNYGNYLVQRDGSGGFSCGSVTMGTSVVAGDFTVAATFYVKSGGTTLFQVAQPSGEVFCNAPGHFSHAIIFNQVAAMNAYNGGANANAFLAPNIGNWQGQGLAYQWLQWSTKENKSDITPLDDPLSVVRHNQLHGVRYVHTGVDVDARTVVTPQQIGFVAEDWADLVPEVVHRDSNGTVCAMDYSRVGVITFQALKHFVQQTDDRIQQLTDEITALRALVDKPAA